MKKKLQIKLLMALLLFNKSFGGLPPEGKTKVTIQGQALKPCEIWQQLLDGKINIQREIIIEKHKMLKLKLIRYLTDHQRDQIESYYRRRIRYLKEMENSIPDSKEEKIIISTLEHSFTENFSLGIQALLKENKLLNKNRERPIEAKIFSQFQLFKLSRKRRAYLFIISPHVILTHYTNPQLGAKAIMERYVHYKKRTNIYQMEMGVIQGPWGVKYSLGFSRGVKFKNGFLFMVQNFTDVDKKNPVRVYRTTSKQLVSVIKDNYDQGFSWQIGVFNQTSPKPFIPLYQGVFFSLWRYF